jgi:hypothetical protein
MKPNYVIALEAVKEAYRAGGYKEGFLFLYSPSSTLAASTRLLILARNPLPIRPGEEHMPATHGGRPLEVGGVPVAVDERGFGTIGSLQDEVFEEHPFEQEIRGRHFIGSRPYGQFARQVSTLILRQCEQLGCRPETLLKLTLVSNLLPFASKSWPPRPTRSRPQLALPDGSFTATQVIWGVKMWHWLLLEAMPSSRRVVLLCWKGLEKTTTASELQHLRLLVEELRAAGNYVVELSHPYNFRGWNSDLLQEKSRIAEGLHHALSQ